jgi:hypothetical protein
MLLKVIQYKRRPWLYVGSLFNLVKYGTFNNWMNHFQNYDSRNYENKIQKMLNLNVIYIIDLQFVFFQFWCQWKSNCFSHVIGYCSLCLQESSMDRHVIGQYCLFSGFLSLEYGLLGHTVPIQHDPLVQSFTIFV